MAADVTEEGSAGQGSEEHTEAVTHNAAVIRSICV